MSEEPEEIRYVVFYLINGHKGGPLPCSLWLLLDEKQAREWIVEAKLDRQNLKPHSFAIWRLTRHRAEIVPDPAGVSLA